MQNDTPIITLVNTLLKTAIGCKASDIHCEPTEQGLRIRLRIDGILVDHQLIDSTLMAQVISRLKVMAHINIAEKRMPHDGKFTIQEGNRSIDLRVSTFPSLYGEKVVIRILDRSLHEISLESLGMSRMMLEQLKALLAKSHGFFLVTGPTGSGKTTTLYAALSYLNEPHKNIVTLEDPVEYNVGGITQGQINPDAGFTFSKGIRAVLRQDPDILMVGEIRDKETVQTAIEASLTGHLVLSTLHTNDAPSVIIRLMDMGVEPFLINAAISGILAQRLARKICLACREEVIPNEQERSMMHRLGISRDSIYKGTGCKACLGLGYKGRIGIFQLLPLSSDLRSLIVNNPQCDALYLQAHKEGMQSLAHDGIQKIHNGIITPSGLIRAVF